MAALKSTVDTAAECGGVHPETIRRLYRDGKVPGYKVGRILKFDVDEVREALKSRPSTTLASPDFDALDAP